MMVKHRHKYEVIGKRRETLYLFGLLGGSGPMCIHWGCTCGDSYWGELQERQNNLDRPTNKTGAEK